MIIQIKKNIMDFKIPIYFLYEKDREQFINGLIKIFGSVEKIPTVEPDREHNEKKTGGGKKWVASDFLYLINHSHETNEFLAEKLGRSTMSIKLSRNIIYDINTWVNKKKKQDTPITLELVKEFLEDK